MGLLSICAPQEGLGELVVPAKPESTCEVDAALALVIVSVLVVTIVQDAIVVLEGRPTNSNAFSAAFVCNDGDFASDESFAAICKIT